MASSQWAAFALTPSARWAMLLVIWEEKSIIPWITVADVVLKRDLLDDWLWRELRALWAAIWEAEYPSGIELVNPECRHTG